VLLYWDDVGSIVPEQLRGRFTPYMRELTEVGLLTPIDTGRWGYEIEGAGMELLDELDQTGETERRSVALGQAVRVPVIHSLKFGGHRLVDEFVERGLAERADRAHHGWFRVEEKTAGEFMTRLARVLGEKYRMDPITDRPAPLASVGISVSSAAEAGLADALAEVRMPVLEAILPGPVHPVPPDELKKFKKQHASLLQPFRQRVDAKLVAVAREDDPEARELLLEQARHELVSERDEVSAAMRTFGWRSIARGIMMAAIPAVWTGATGKAMGLIPAAPGLVFGAVDARRSRVTRKAKLGEPLAYAALARARFK
jgi:hypothetical protein